MVESVGAGESERRRLDALCSEEWDRPDDIGLRARYVVFSAQRTGSEWLCDFLRQRGIGIPFEYLNHAHALRIADRLGCRVGEYAVDLPQYFALLEPLRARHGIFGMKLQPDQLRTFSLGNDDEAVRFLRRFDRVLLVLRRDRLLQAISLARAHLTNQWHLYGNDRSLGITAGDEVLFPMIDARLATLRENDRYMSKVVATLEPKAVRAVWYESLSAPGELEGVANWLWDGLGGGARQPEADRSIALGRKLDEAEARAIKRRYLDFTSTPR